MTKAIVFAAVFSLVFSIPTLSQDAFAGSSPIGASNFQPPGDPSVSGVHQGGNVWLIPPPTGTDETPIEWDPNSGPWVKLLQQVEIIDAQGNIVCGCTLIEDIQVQGHPWSDWHEILPIDFVWTGVTIEIDRGGDGQVDETLTDADPEVVIHDYGVWVEFNPLLQPGDILHIQKTFDYLPTQQQPFSMDIIIEQFPTVPDFGDDPDAPYPTLLASDGARHGISPFVLLGSVVDPEPDGQPTTGADGDDTDGTDDEDGVSFSGSFTPGGTVTATVSTITPGFFLNAWVDLNQDGVFSGGAPEQIATDWSLTSGDTFSFTIPAGALPDDDIYSRFRYDSASGLAPTGFGPEGEVEDYVFSVRDRAIGGTSMPIDTVAVLIAGATNSGFFWLTAMLVVAAGAFGTLYYTVKRTSKSE